MCETTKPCTCVRTLVVRAWVGKEFPDTRQTERRIKFIRVGEGRIAATTAGQLPYSQREPTLNRCPWSIFIPRVQGMG